MNLSTAALVKQLGEVPGAHIPTDAEMEKLRAVLLEIADDVIGYCEAHGIRYGLGGGSVLGAVRHRGFIPWDDDIDIDMPRIDYLRFIEGFPKAFPDKYTVQSPETTPERGLSIARVRLNGTIVLTPEEPSQLDGQNGVFLDIFIIENTYDSALLRNMHGVLCMAAGLLLSCRRVYRDKEVYQRLSDDRDFQKSLRVKFAIGWMLSWLSVGQLTRFASWAYSLCKNEDSRYVVTPAGMYHFFGELYERAKFVETVPASFEGRTWEVPAATEEYLHQHYGDFMQLPPEDKREKHVYLAFDLGERA